MADAKGGRRGRRCLRSEGGGVLQVTGAISFVAVGYLFFTN